MATAESNGSAHVDQKPIVNFSRPRNNSRTTGSDAARSEGDSPSGVRSHNTSRSPDRIKRDYPDEARFSLDIDLPDSPQNASNRQPSNPSPQREHSSGNDTTTSSPESTKTATSAKPLMPKGILKYTSIEQYSERATSSDGNDSAASHHTTSEQAISSGSSGSNNSSVTSHASRHSEWTSSEHDTSMFSEKEIKKMEKKGINPSLYAEMKTAKKEGGSCVGTLTGHAFVT